mmetsp:Transcript_27703/g.45991  ORF Transcript_27703/g.45991 Transcript_27703/m.45991 type:complete len:238 (+) Transcript_27703:77-790(+)|eukprot:CAMPEP_0119014756 /NCGR_PEP_ID=MMETSP1176-20130426/10369_1 /TAXON_ID=265551 /ORGANISM="Synedropsis recta cf, Strain CCMP1620" /LENGTH=237 /DNA_ID=CAMNT_0006967995 /DNA_START=55 /DNA_END=768 /DNA_ORIENTATION=+
MCCVNETSYTLNSDINAAVAPTRVSLERNRKRARRVSFDKAEVVSTVAPSSLMSVSERHGLWYQQTDLSKFKEDARDLCRQIRNCDGVIEQPLLDPRLDAALEAAGNECARGLEHRISMERQKNKYLAMRAIVKAQQRYQTPEQLAVVASKCTAWAKEVALCTGYQDFYQAYNPALVHLVPQTPTVKFPLLSRKRSPGGSATTSDEEAASPKRARTISPVPVSRTTAAISAPVVLLR